MDVGDKPRPLCKFTLRLIFVAGELLQSSYEGVACSGDILHRGCLKQTQL